MDWPYFSENILALPGTQATTLKKNSAAKTTDI